MGSSISTMKWAAPAAWAVDLAAQMYGMTSDPSMLDVHNANMSYFSPQPYFIAGFFTPQQVVQVAWLYRLITLSTQAANTASTSPATPNPKNNRELSTLLDYAPTYTLGNISIAIWMLFWNNSHLGLSDAAVWVNSLSQLAYLVGVTGNLGPLNTRSWSSILTHLNVKTFAGIGVLDLLHNTASAFAKDAAPSLGIKIATGVGFLGASAFSDWIFGSCLVYDLIALSIGQREYDVGWSKLLAGYAVGSAAIVGIKNWLRPPYISQPEDYEGLAYGNDNDVAARV